MADVIDDLYVMHRASAAVVWNWRVSSVFYWEFMTPARCLSPVIACFGGKFIPTWFEQIKLSRHGTLLFTEAEQFGAEFACCRFCDKHCYFTRQCKPANSVEWEIQSVTRITRDHRVKQGWIRTVNCCNWLALFCLFRNSPSGLLLYICRMDYCQYAFEHDIEL